MTINEAINRPVYYDCDTGIDDALGLIYLLDSPSVNLVGIGTVCGNTFAEQAADNNLRLLQLAGHPNIPVAIGEKRFRNRDYLSQPAPIHGANGLGNLELPAAQAKPIDKGAPEFLIELSHQYQGELEVIAVGPLTNLAKALDLDPSLPARIKQVTIMGGAFYTPGNKTPAAEANILDDPEAAQVVLAAKWPITLVGLDVTMKHFLEEKHREQMAHSDRPVAQALAEILNIYFDFYSNIYGARCCALHDPLAVAIAVGDIKAINSPLVPTVVETGDGPARGQTIADLRTQRAGYRDVPGANTRIVLDTDRPLAALITDRICNPQAAVPAPPKADTAPEKSASSKSPQTDQPQKITVVGSLNVDICVELDRRPNPGETVMGDDVTYLPGGKGANQAAAASALGGRVTMVGAVGTDANAQTALSGLQQVGTNLSQVENLAGATGVAIINLDREGENSIIVSPGANGKVDRDFVERKAAAIREAQIVVCQCEIPVDGIERVAELTTGRFILNVAPSIPLPESVIKRANPLIVNEHEAAQVLETLGVPVPGTGEGNTAASAEVRSKASPEANTTTGSKANVARSSEAGSAANPEANADSIVGSESARPERFEAMARTLLAQGLESVVITLGKSGSLVAQSDDQLTAIPTAAVKPVDTTGAGDAFVGALAAKLAEGAGLVDAARFASRVASFACQGYGAQASYPTLDDELPALEKD
ncbi:hypothetical protein BSR29_04810 [Boudabousia liubingyangii]|uniref:Ribokinase n=1 Tax=Boudabousia liubingyangii TaxID=1921764 RepID=A0A1Q5PL90_9ACTO|nr:PfkB family carbohydrate kinase [Boudabousia liubingyangii]OKL47821.1 hypothetical protein BSR29_04810 [Boudabousia liubingyangii]